MLYLIPERLIDDLDRREGHPGHYERTTIEVAYQGESVKAITYRTKNPLLHEAAPNDKYFRTVARGARRFLSPSYRDGLIEHMRFLMEYDREQERTAPPVRTALSAPTAPAARTPEEVLVQLEALREEVRAGVLRDVLRRPRLLWGGADVVIVLRAPEHRQKSTFYPDPLLCGDPLCL